MTHIWYEHEDCIYDLSKVCRFFAPTRDGYIEFNFGNADTEDALIIRFRSIEERDSEYQRIKEILDKIY